MYLRGDEDIEAAARAHGLRFTTNPPANTTFLVGNLIGDFRVEIEAEAVVSRKRD
jgi:enamine deaminase RidA (YjgF/YER057c/UK114 family)